MQQSVLPRIAHDHFGDVRFQQVIQPSSAGSFFEGDPPTFLYSPNEREDGGSLRLDNGLYDQFSGCIPDRNGDACLMYVHGNILFPVHGVLLSVGSSRRVKRTLKGAPPHNALTRTGSSSTSASSTPDNLACGWVTAVSLCSQRCLSGPLGAARPAPITTSNA